MLTLRVPEGAKTLKIANAILWFEGEVLYSRPTEGDFVMQTREEMAADVERMKIFIGNKKVCMIAESHPKSESPRKEDRDYIAQQLEEIIKAIAIITPNAVSRMVANLFFLFKPPSFPTKMFVNVSDAKIWLETCLKKGPGVSIF
jgi:hypothetical protein